MIRLCAVDAVSEDRPLKIELEGRAPVAVFKIGEAIFVTDDVCTHGQASLSEDGERDGFTIVCSWHDGAFDIRTGTPTARPCTQPLRVYRVSIADGAIGIAPED